MLFFTYLTGGNPPLFMDFRKAWESWEIRALAEKIGMTKLDESALWLKKGFVDGDNSGSASLTGQINQEQVLKKLWEKFHFHVLMKDISLDWAILLLMLALEV